MEKATLLSRSMLFADLAEQELKDLAELAHFRHIEARQVVCQQGFRGEQMFAIVSGRVKVAVSSEDGKEAIFAVLGPGDFFGEISLLDGLGRSASVTAVDAGEILVIGRESFLRFLERHPVVAIKLMAVLCKRLRAADSLIEDIHFLSLPDRLAKALTTLAERHGQQTGEGMRIDLRISQEELGNLVGAARESVNKQLKAWEAQGKLSTAHGQMIIKRPLADD